MVQYIDKDAIVAEIEKRIKSYILLQQKPEMSDLQEELQYKIDCLNSIKGYILNTLEVKETNSIWNDARKTIPEDSSNQIVCIKENDLAVSTVGKIVNGTIKWAYLNDLLNISNVQVKEVEFEKEDLTWEDIREMYIIFAEIDAEIEFCKTDIQGETIGYYQEALKRFKSIKEGIKL